MDKKFIASILVIIFIFFLVVFSNNIKELSGEATSTTYLCCQPGSSISGGCSTTVANCGDLGGYFMTKANCDAGKCVKCPKCQTWSVTQQKCVADDDRDRDGISDGCSDLYHCNYICQNGQCVARTGEGLSKNELGFECSPDWCSRCPVKENEGPLLGDGSFCVNLCPAGYNCFDRTCYKVYSSWWG